ncbi:amidohydrolase [Candidatus Bathyarchaeota archaeon]|nr:amidohydrolase [Candidatus Bathyarchaeota archaeon]
MKKVAYVNGNIITMEDDAPKAEALLTIGEYIAEVGSNEKIKGMITPDVEIHDLKGKTMIPSFIDCHAHPMGFGQSLLNVDCKTPPIFCIDDLIKAVSETAKTKKKSEWIIGRGYDDFKLKEKRHPTRWDLDKAAPENPVMITRLCGHLSVVNSLALNMAGITKDTPDPEGGQIDHDESGEPNGVLRGGARGPVSRLIPRAGVEQLRKGINLAAKEFLKRGVTSVSDAGVGDPNTMKAYQLALKTDNMPLRINLMMSGGTLKELTKLGLTTGFGDEWLRIGAIKLVFDGSTSGRTAAMSVPYIDTPGSLGILYMSQEELNQLVLDSHQAGFQVGIHAIGDRAITGVLDAYEAALNKLPKDDHRLRIEHCGINTNEIIQRIKRLNVIPVPQPIFLWGEGESYRAGLGEERIGMAYPAKSWIDAGISPAFSSDCPATSGSELISPLLGIHVAVNRKTDEGKDIGKQQRITIHEALKAYTLTGAYATFEEKNKGSIKPGKLADLVILSQDPTKVESDKIKDIVVEATILGGKTVYKNT